MLFTESQLQMSANPMAVLNEATYLDETEALIRPQTIPVAENSRIGAYVVRFDDVHRLAESNGADYIDAIVAIAESSGIDPTYLKVAVDEAEIIANPDVVLALPENSVVVAPISEQNVIYQYVLECVNLWDQMPDTAEADQALAEAIINDTYLEAFLEDSAASSGNNNPSMLGRIGGAIKAGAGKVGNFFTQDFKNAKQHFGDMMDIGKKASEHAKANNGTLDFNSPTVQQMNNDVQAHAKGALISGGKGALKILGVGAAIAGAKKLLSSDQPKSVLAQKIAALRKVYQSWMQKAAKGGPGVGDKIKQAAAKLLSIIDALMAKMQKAAG